MELGLFTCGYQRYPLEQAFEDAGRFGYDYIELWGGYPHAYVEDLSLTGVREVERLVQKYHIPVKCFTPEHNAYPFNYMTGDAFQWVRSMNYLEKAIELTAAMGASKMLFSAGHAGYRMSVQEIDERLQKSLERLVQKAEQQSVTLILEPLTVYESNVITGLNDLERALDKVDSPNLGRRFGYLHVIDNDGVSDSHILPGEGNIPLEGILREIRRAGYDGCATIELVTGYLKEPSVYAELAIERIREMLKNE